MNKHYTIMNKHYTIIIIQEFDVVGNLGYLLKEWLKNHPRKQKSKLQIM